METAQRTTTMDATDRRCPQCGAELNYDAAAKGLYCAYCEYHEDVVSDVPEEEDHAVEADLFSEAPTDGYEWGTETKVVVCESCGAESVYDSLQLSDVCPYCGSNHVMKASENVHTLAPGGVIPFQIDAETGSQKFVKWLKGRLFCPSAAKKNAKAEPLKGIYLPYWTYDSNTTSHYYARYGISRTRVQNGKTTTYTEWHETSGVHSMFHDDVLVPASKRHDSSLLSRIEPFDTSKNKKYRPEYLAGYLAERYSVGLQEGFAEAKKKIDREINSGIRESISKRYGASTVDIHTLQTKYVDASYKYLLLPVWMSSYRYKDKVYHFFVNGQTGKVGGKTPISALRVAIAIILALAVIAFIYMYMQS